MKTLKRYIQRCFGLTPAAYWERWGLPADYPMVAPSYAEKRSALARQGDLGRKLATEQPVGDTAEVKKEGGIRKDSKTRTRRNAPADETKE